VNRRDVIIVGGGPAGLTAGLYAARGLLDVMLIRGGLPVCQAITTDIIENYPGFPDGIDGPDLVARMEQQARRFGLEIVERAVESLREEDGGFVVETDRDAFHARAVVVATGAAPRSLGVPGESQFRGRGVSYCATCDGAFFTDAVVAVVGGGDAAVKEAVFLTRFASKVYLIHRRDQFRAEPVLVRTARDSPKIEFVLDHVMTQVNGDNLVDAVTIRNVRTNEESRLNVEGVFIFTGIRPNSDIAAPLVDTDGQGFILTDREMATSRPGIFAAGDVCQKHLRQVVTAVADGAVAIESIERYLAESRQKVHPAATR